MNYIDDKEAADYCRVKLRYLRRQMYNKTGPEFIRPSPRTTLFTKQSLDAWMATWKRSDQSVPPE